MANFAVPPMPPPVAPADNASDQEISLWRRRISGYLGTLNTFIEEVAESYIANSSQLASGIITADQIQPSAITSDGLQDSAVTNTELVAITVDSITSHASVGGVATVSFSISRTKKPLISPSTTASMWFLQLGTVTTASADVQVFNVNGPTSGTVYISYY